MLTSNERIKNSKSRFVRIASQDKVIGTNNQFTVDLASNGGALDNVKGYIVHSAQVPNVFNNITSKNNRIDVSFPGPHTETPFRISITEGYYLIDDLLNQINAQIATTIASFGNTYSLIFSKVGVYPTEKVLVTVSGVSTGTLCLFNVPNDILLTLGIESDVNALTGSTPFCVNNGVPEVAQNIPNLTGETACYIHSRILATNNLTEGNGTFSVVDKINLDKPYGSMCYTNFNDDTIHQNMYYPFETKKTLRRIDINLRNENGDQLILPPNFYFSMMIKIFYA